jgi:hypothetical protein
VKRGREGQSEDGGHGQSENSVRGQRKRQSEEGRVEWPEIERGGRGQSEKGMYRGRVKSGERISAYDATETGGDRKGTKFGKRHSHRQSSLRSRKRTR